MTAIAHFIAITCYIGAAALAATPFARPVGAPVRGVVALLAARRPRARSPGLRPTRSASGSCRSPGSDRRCRSPASCWPPRCCVVEIAGARREPDARRGAARGHPDDLREPHRTHARRRAAGRARRVAVRAHRAELRRHRGVRHRGGRGLHVSRRATRAQVAALRRDLPLLPAARDARSREPRRGDRGMARPHARRRARRHVFASRIASSASQARVGDRAPGSRSPAIALGRVVGGWQARRAAMYSSVSFVAVVVLYVAFRVAETNGGGRFL